MKKDVVILWALSLLLLTGLSAGAQELFDVKASDAHFQKGLKLYFERQYSQAAREFEQAVQINPDDYRSYYFLGYSRYQLGAMQHAQEAFEQAYEINPEYSPIPKNVKQD